MATIENSASDRPRLTVAYLLKEGLRKFLNMERGWVRTASQLTLNPGKMLRAYIDGDRTGYIHPLSYLVLNGLIIFSAMKVFNLEALMTSAEAFDFGAEVKPMQIRSQEETSGFAFENTNLTYVGLVIPFAIFLRLFFRKTGYNLAEMAVVALYAVSHSGLVGIMLLPTLGLFDYSLLTYTAIGMLLGLSYFAYMSFSFFGRRLWPMIKTWMAYIAAYITFIMVFSTVIVVYQLVIRNEIQNRESWHLGNAIELNQPTKLRQLLAEGWDPNATTGFTPLHQAVLAEQPALMSHLVSFGADLESRDYLENTPLLLALERQNWPAVYELVSLGASATAISARGSSVLMEALRLDNRKLAAWALENGADVNAYVPEENRATALMLAAADDDLDMVQRLLDAGADPDVRNRNGRNALNYAEEQPVIDLLAAVTTPVAPDTTLVGETE
ncbi:MAG: ankyrin repeat domain-containing protein [Bacteroidota bacterium]